MPARLFGFLLLWLLAGCSPARPSDAKITVTVSKRAAGATTAEIELGGRKVELPANDVNAVAPAPVLRDASGRRLAYPTTSGAARILYVVGASLFVGPLVAWPPDFRAVPDFDHAMGPLWEMAEPERRRDLIREVRAERGETGFARLLVAAAYVDDVAWEFARDTLAPSAVPVLRGAFADALEPGKSPLYTRRGIREIDADLRTNERAELVATRTKELVHDPRQSNVAAALLRIVIANDQNEAAAIGCSVLSERVELSAMGPERYKLLESATLAIAAAGTTCPSSVLENFLTGEGSCRLMNLRCGQDGPLAMTAFRDDNEPLCTKEELALEVAKDLSRTTSHVLDTPFSRAPLFAYAALTASNTVPESFVVAHTRRRLPIVQPSAPECDASLSPGTPCHCAEPTLRYGACKTTTPLVTNDRCRFSVDAHRITNVVSTRPP